jgi:hypothetical protein
MDEHDQRVRVIGPVEARSQRAPGQEHGGDGGRLERVGVSPDEIVLPSPADLAAGRDPVLARAVALAGGTLTAEDAGRFTYRE